MPDMRIVDLGRIDSLNDSDYVVVGSGNETYKATISTLKQAVRPSLGRGKAYANGVYHASDEGLYGYDTFTVNVQNTRELEMLSVSKNGYYTPSPSVDGFYAVSVNVGDGDVEPLIVTANGTYTAPTGKAYSPVTVNVGDDSFALTDYIESSGTQWIDTGYIVKDNSQFDVVYNMNASQTSFPTLFGVRDNDSGATAGRCTFFVKHNNFISGSYAWGTADANMNLPSLMYLSAKKQRCIFTKGVLKVQQADGNALAFDFTSPYSASNTRSVYIFTLNQGGADYGANTHFLGKLYRFRIYESNTLVHEYIPWTDSNNVVCLKDTISSDLLYNAGTGVFVRGSDT